MDLEELSALYRTFGIDQFYKNFSFRDDTYSL